MAWIVIRVRGTIHSRHDIAETLRLLHLTRANHATIVPETASLKGMLTKVQGYVTWGEAAPETVERLLRERGVTESGGPITDGALQDIPGAALRSVPELTRAVVASGLAAARGVRPLLRLKAPRGGWRSTKRPFGLGGALGYRGRAVNDLAQRML